MEKVCETIETLAAVARENYAARGRGQPTKDKMAHEAYLAGLRDAKAVVEDAMKPAEEPVEDGPVENPNAGNSRPNFTMGDSDGVQA